MFDLLTLHAVSWYLLQIFSRGMKYLVLMRDRMQSITLSLLCCFEGSCSTMVGFLGIEPICNTVYTVLIIYIMYLGEGGRG
jgi:hypothetical protein